MDCLNYALIAREYAVSKLGTIQPYRKLREYKANIKEQEITPDINKEETKTESKPVPQKKIQPKREVRRNIGRGWFGK